MKFSPLKVLSYMVYDESLVNQQTNQFVSVTFNWSSYISMFTP